VDCQEIAVWYIIQVHGQIKLQLEIVIIFQSTAMKSTALWYWCWYSSRISIL